MATTSFGLLFPGFVSSRNRSVRSHLTFFANGDRVTIAAAGSKGVMDPIKRREVIGMFLGATSLFPAGPFRIDSQAAGLPPEDKPKLCDDACEKELENVPMVTTESGLQYKDITVGAGPSPPVGFQVAANYVAMVPSGQIFDRIKKESSNCLFPMQFTGQRAGVPISSWLRPGDQGTR